MVSDRPIQRIQVGTDESGLLLDPHAALAALPPAVPADPVEASQYLTVYLDWQPMGSDPSRRPARRQFDDLANQLLATYAPHTPAAKGLAIAIERVSRYLDGDRVDRNLDLEPLPVAAQGVVIVARAMAGVFDQLPLGVPVETRVTATPIPALAELAWVREEYEPYAVVVADQQEATLTFIAQRRSQREITAQGATYPFRRKAGGNQRRYQARAGERLDQFARGLADGIRQELDERGVHVLIVAGDEVITSPLMQFFPKSGAEIEFVQNAPEAAAGTAPVPRAGERPRSEVAQTLDRLGVVVASLRY